MRHDNLASVLGSLMEGTTINLTLRLVVFIPLLAGKIPSSGSLESPSPHAGVLSRGASQGTTTEAEQEMERWCRRGSKKEETGSINSEERGR